MNRYAFLCISVESAMPKTLVGVDCGEGNVDSYGCSVPRFNNQTQLHFSSTIIKLDYTVHTVFQIQKGDLSIS